MYRKHAAASVGANFGSVLSFAGSEIMNIWRKPLNASKTFRFRSKKIREGKNFSKVVYSLERTFNCGKFCRNRDGLG